MLAGTGFVAIHRYGARQRVDRAHEQLEGSADYQRWHTGQESGEPYVSEDARRRPGGDPVTWLEHRRPDWGNPHFGQLLDAEIAREIRKCGTAWQIEWNVETDDYRARIANYCHEQLFCGICASSKSNERASTWLEHFRAANEALSLPIAGRSVYFTLPRALSEEIAGREDRREVLNALHRGIDAVMRSLGLLAWVKTTHFVSSKDPRRPHVHFPVFYLAADGDHRPLPGYLDGEAFEELRVRFLDKWDEQVHKVVKKYGLADPGEMQVVHLAYYKTLDELEGKLRYELRPPMQDPMMHCTESVEQLRAAVGVVLSFLYPPGAVVAFRRTRGAGVFGPRSITTFFEDRGYEKRDKAEDEEDAGAWEVIGTGQLLQEGREVCVFVIVGTGQVVRVRRDRVATAAHGCAFSWVRSA